MKWLLAALLASTGILSAHAYTCTDVRALTQPPRLPSLRYEFPHVGSAGSFRTRILRLAIKIVSVEWW
jgi:hypothetical protein